MFAILTAFWRLSIPHLLLEILIGETGRVSSTSDGLPDDTLSARRQSKDGIRIRIHPLQLISTSWKPVTSLKFRIGGLTQGRIQGHLDLVAI